MTIKIDQSLFIMTFAADGDFHAHLDGQETFLSKKTGSLIYTLSDPLEAEMNMGADVVEDLLDDTAMVNECPENYLEVESMSHGQHHAVLQDFLCSSWTTDQSRLDNASSLYYSRKSIGFWLKNVKDQGAVKAYLAFRELANLRLAEEFLRSNGIDDFEWV